MATIFRARRNTNPGSGGKILRGRRIAAVTSPYARPNSPPSPSSSSPPPSPPESPNWLLGLVVPATRKIVNGAGKLVSTVFGSNDSPSSSESDTASSYDDDGNDDNDDNTSEGSDSLNLNGTTSDANKYLETEPQAIVQKSEAKLEIERLLMQETFSRDECNRLTKIIQSRVVESHTSNEGGDVGQYELPDADRTIASTIAAPGALQSDTEKRKSYSFLDSGFHSLSPRPLAYHHTAIMEAKKWLEEKKSESCSKLEYGHRTFTSSPFLLPNATEGEVGSPVVLAKTYMKARPPWASPSSSHVEFQTPSPIAMHLVKEETPYTIGAHSLSSSKLLKRSSLADGSWNILAESRRVRFKSEEDTFQPNSSIHNESSALDLEHKDSHTSSRDGKQDLDVIHDSDSLPATRSIDSSVDLPAKIPTNGGFTVNGALGNETPSFVPAMIVSNQNQDLEDPRLTEGEGCTTFVTNELPDFVSLQEDDQSAELVKSEPNVMPSDAVKPALQSEVNPTGVDGSREVRVQQDTQLGEPVQIKNSSQLNQFSGLMETESIDDSRPPGGNHQPQNEINGSRERVTANGFPSSASRCASNGTAGLNVQSGTGPGHEASSESKLGTGIPVEEETCELLSEASVEIPINDEETDSVASEPQTSSSRHSKDLLLAQTQPSSRKLSTSRRAEKQQQGKKIGRYSRRGGKGRGK
ncbi:hypothetical protein BVC80_9081g101 [Macleaya cordata]|uniref:Protein KAKU4 n=1 Tax=Macleaya cordata TaxID=56857 RepID=A0A200PRV4_MACCD|nr:hypothetical protein BVC80_9081g101 [Macleaya cordata]